MTPLLVVPRLSLAVPAWVPPPPPYASTCTAPGCRMRPSERHHVVARSQQRSILGIDEAMNWLEIDGELICVVTDLCRLHHTRLESGLGGCKSRLRWAGGWIWYDRATNADMESGKAGIWWYDDDTLWKLKGFCRGEYRYDPDSNS